MFAMPLFIGNKFFEALKLTTTSREQGNNTSATSKERKVRFS